MRALFTDLQSTSALAQAIVDTVREPLLVLDADLNVNAAGRSFYGAFDLASKDILGRSIYDLIDGQLNLPAVHSLLAEITKAGAIVEAIEIEATLPRIGLRTMILNARKVFYDGEGPGNILLAFDDITDRRAIESAKAVIQTQTSELLLLKDTLLEEMQHRVANSLQIIASILLLKARAATSEETRQDLQDAHQRVLLVATVQEHLKVTGRGELIEIGPYLLKLTDSLAASMVADPSAIAIVVTSDPGSAASAQAVSIGLIVIELIINALKHAFPNGRPDAQIRVRYEVSGSNWRLSVADNGVGKQVGTTAPAKGGLGTTLVTALAQQLDAQVEFKNSPNGMAVTITYATFDAQLPQAA
jgi:two-component sensor histidine kinase